MNILITGSNSYVGKSFKEWLARWPNKYSVNMISVRNDDWKKSDFSQYDVIVHMAAVVHQKEKVEMQELYFKINRDLTLEIANKAKAEGVKQFIFMSTMSVYGLTGKISENVVITKDTIPNPNTFYGMSKLEAEKELIKLKDNSFNIAILRPPMIYGPNCPGNYKKLRKLAIMTTVFPEIYNQRSMIFIQNLSEFIRLIIENREMGLFFPQNKKYVSTTKLVKLITKEHSKNIYLSRGLFRGIKLFGKRINVLNKVFGNLVFDLSLSGYREFQYCIIDLEKSVEICENKL
ncbi:UDP-glucose 4-epimerase [Anaeromicrobium sediminis]|uniref:UDP-glucose 4-epimerase n=1 Tax=Anaeromicrobium sediminis TaxID=1478221 RepID=A0A267MKT5_9FIRM|nr:UDP-glucose 4-epimerase [Anaeromicrobium sediminis]